MRKSVDIKSLTINIITFIILMSALYLAYKFYQKNNLNGFMLSEANLSTSHFQRDDETKYSDVSSYKITSNEFNDAMFSKEIEVEKNTPYKVTCMVKTKGVTAEEVSSKLEIITPNRVSSIDRLVIEKMKDEKRTGILRKYLKFSDNKLDEDTSNFILDLLK